MNNKSSLRCIASIIVSILLLLGATAVQAAAPTATTDAATAIGQFSAKLHGTVSANGASTTVSFEWGLSSLYGSGLNAAVESPLIGSASGTSVSLSIGSLSCNTLYHYHVTANNGTGGEIDGGDLTFTTAACPGGTPTAVTDAATAIGLTTAKLHGTVTANGTSTTVSFEWGLSSLYGSGFYAAVESPLTGSASGASVSLSIGGLSCNTLYHYHVMANNGTGGDIYGGDLTFTTAACPGGTPTAVTDAATAIGQTSAKLNGTINANGTSTNTGFEYGLTMLYGTGIGATPSSFSTSVDTPVSTVISSLSCSTLYHFHVFAFYGGTETQYGDDLTFTTADCSVSAPTATTDAATSITQTTAALNGTVTANGASTTVSFEWGLSSSYGSGTFAAAESPLLDSASGAPVSLAISSLSCNTLYHFHTIANNGSGGDIDGGDLTFTTAPCTSPSITPRPVPALGDAALLLLGVLIFGLGFGTLRTRSESDPAP